MSGIYVCELRSAERDYFRRISFNLSLDRLRDQPHKWWSVAKKACGLKHNEAIPSLISADQRISTSPVEKAECLNSSFSEQCNAPSPAELPNCTPQSECRFSFKMIEPLDVLKKLASLNSWKAPGIDGVFNRLLKQCAASLAGPLCHVFNTSLEEGKFRDKWKNAVIQPIFKQKGSRSNPKKSEMLQNFSQTQGTVFHSSACISSSEGFFKNRSAHFCGKSPSSGVCPSQIAILFSLGLKFLMK